MLCASNLYEHIHLFLAFCLHPFHSFSLASASSASSRILSFSLSSFHIVFSQLSSPSALCFRQKYPSPAPSIPLVKTIVRQRYHRHKNPPFEAIYLNFASLYLYTFSNSWQLIAFCFPSFFLFDSLLLNCVSRSLFSFLFSFSLSVFFGFISFLFSCVSENCYLFPGKNCV
ncbi:hypothetical protein CPC08DRAFT_417500 [Agrocybe pediades]|nr:hypothetical protein CPC08DRAFT_417500 [Agrocybe pediades]